MKINSDVSSQSMTQPEMRKQAKLVDAAQQFEGTMLQEMLKPMQHGQDSWGGEEKSDDTTFDTMSSFGTETMAKALSKAGGFGIARQVVSQITAEHQQKPEKKTFKY